MTKEKLAFFKAELEKKLTSLKEKHAANDAAEMAAAEQFTDMNDIASSEIEKTEYFQLRDKELASINQLIEALRRIDTGAFGVCDGCGEDIAEKRLMAYPLTANCFDCQSEMEEKK